RTSLGRERWWLLSLATMPYASYLGLVMMLGVYISALKQRGDRVLKLCHRMGFGWLSLGLLVSSALAVYKGDSFLQLANFLPFFLLFGVLVNEPTVTASQAHAASCHEDTSQETSNILFRKLEHLAQGLLLSAIPFMAVACIQYLIKQLAIAQSSIIRLIPDTILTQLQPYDHRVNILFGNSNALCAYLVIILGLSLGLAIQGLRQKDRPHFYWAQLVGLGLCIGAIFATGSRNGLIVTLTLIAIALYAARSYRWVFFLGIAVISGLVFTAINFGFGERAMSLALFTQDARIEIWQQSLVLIQQRPIFGWGFSGFRSQYVPYSIQHYAMLWHAHNIWLLLASEAGIPVMLGFNLIVGRICYGGARTLRQTTLSKRDRAVLLSYLLAFAGCSLYGIFDVLLHDSRINVITWVTLAAIYSMTQTACNDIPDTEPTIQ
ncbi:MAG: O-antigen ligase family protein, partial [Cyanobacteria bacterium P01_F01_bin.3]